MKVNNYIKVLSTVLIMFGYYSNGYSTSPSRIINNKIALQKTNAITKSGAKQIENDLRSAWISDNLNNELDYAYRKYPYYSDVKINEIIIDGTLNKYITKITENPALYNDEFVQSLKNFKSAVSEYLLLYPNKFDKALDEFKKSCNEYINFINKQNNEHLTPEETELVQVIKDCKYEVLYQLHELFPGQFLDLDISN